MLTLGGRLIGMSTSGPRRRALVIPAATIERVLDPLLADGRIARGWLGVGLQRVLVPERFRDAAGRDAGLMVVGLASGAPAEQRRRAARRHHPGGRRPPHRPLRAAWRRRWRRSASASPPR